MAWAKSLVIPSWHFLLSHALGFGVRTCMLPWSGWSWIKKLMRTETMLALLLSCGSTRPGIEWASKELIREERVPVNEGKVSGGETALRTSKQCILFWGYKPVASGGGTYPVSRLQDLSNHVAPFQRAIVCWVNLFTTGPLNWYNLRCLPHKALGTSKIVLRRLKIVN